MTHIRLLPIRRFARDEQGVISVWSLFLFITICCIGAAAVDVTHFYAARAQLQVAADLAAHSALYTRRYGSYSDGAYMPFTDDAARTAAITSVQFGMPSDYYGNVVVNEDIDFGYLNWETGQVDSAADLPSGNAEEIEDAATIIANGPTAATVVSHRVGTSAVSSFLFRIIGVNSMDVSTSAVFATAATKCEFDQGFFSTDEVIVNSGNDFYTGFCIGTPEFQAQGGNTYQAGVTVTLPDGDQKPDGNLDISKGNLPSNTGIEAATEVEEDTSALLERLGLDDVLARLGSDSHAEALHLLTLPAWDAINVDHTDPGTFDQSLTPEPADNSPTINITPDNVEADKIYVISCYVPPEGKKKAWTRTLSLTGDAGNTFSDAVILTDCDVTIDRGIHLEDFILSTSFDPSGPAHKAFAIHSPSGLTIGRSESPPCAPTGGAALIATRGGVDIAAAAGFHGAVIRADGYVNFQSNGAGYGISIVATGKIDTNSNNDLSACGPAAGAYSRNVSLRLIQ